MGVLKARVRWEHQPFAAPAFAPETILPTGVPGDLKAKTSYSRLYYHYQNPGKDIDVAFALCFVVVVVVADVAHFRD